MSWAGLTSDQGITRNNLQDAVNNSVFVLKNSIPADTKLITKLEAAYYVYLDTSYAPFAAKANNQLVVKSNLVAATPAPYSFTLYVADLGLGEGYSTTGGACSASVYTYTVYSFSSSIVVGTNLYSDPYGTQIYLSSYDTATPYFKYGSSYITFENWESTYTGFEVRSVTSCGPVYYTYTVRLSNNLGTICTDPTYTVYSTSVLLTTGAFIFYDTALTNPVTGYDYVVLASGSPNIYYMNPGTGELTSYTGIDC